LRLETNLPVHVADDPLTAVVRGAGRVMEDIQKFMKVLIKSKRY
jgi:rod shape-determining protein MreB